MWIMPSCGRYQLFSGEGITQVHWALKKLSHSLSNCRNCRVFTPYHTIQWHNYDQKK